MSGTIPVHLANDTGTNFFPVQRHLIPSFLLEVLLKEMHFCVLEPGIIHDEKRKN